MPAPQVRLRPFFYSYSIPFTAANGNQLGVGATATNAVQIEAGHHFVVMQFIFDARLTTAPDLDPSITVQVTDLSSNLPIFDRPLTVGRIFGTAQLPFVLPVPRRFRANGGISATVVNNTGAARDLLLIFAGQKVPVAGAAGAQD